MSTEDGKIVANKDEEGRFQYIGGSKPEKLIVFVKKGENRGKPQTLASFIKEMNIRSIAQCDPLPVAGVPPPSLESKHKLGFQVDSANFKVFFGYAMSSDKVVCRWVFRHNDKEGALIPMCVAVVLAKQVLVPANGTLELS